jgi:hypothetical protein
MYEIDYKLRTLVHVHVHVYSNRSLKCMMCLRSLGHIPVSIQNCATTVVENWYYVVHDRAYNYVSKSGITTTSTTTTTTTYYYYYYCYYHLLLLLLLLLLRILLRLLDPELKKRKDGGLRIRLTPIATHRQTEKDIRSKCTCVRIYIYTLCQY